MFERFRDGKPHSFGKISLKGTLTPFFFYVEPLNVIKNIATRHIRRITLRPITDSGIKLFSLWIKDQEWTEINETHDVNHKVELLTISVMKKVRQFFPDILTKVSSDDAP